MTDSPTQPQESAQSKRGPRIAFVLACCLFVIVVGYRSTPYQNGVIEDLRVVTNLGRIYHGQNYFIERKDSGETLWRESVTGRSVAVKIADEPGNSIALIGTVSSMDRARIVYSVTPARRSRTPVATMYGGKVLHEGPRLVEGQFAYVGPQPRTGIYRSASIKAHYFSNNTRAQQLTLKAIDIPSGKVTAVDTFNANSAVVSSANIYTVTPAPEEYYEMRSAGQWWQEVRSHDKLMQRSIARRVDQCIAEVPANRKLTAFDDTVVWTEPLPFPVRGDRICVLSPGANAPIYILRPDIKKSWYTHPVVCNDRVIWLQESSDGMLAVQVASASIRGGAVATVKLSANLDGNLLGVNGTDEGFLGVYKGSAFCVGEFPNGRGADHPRSICRIDMESPIPILALRQLPAGAKSFSIDDGYLYFTIDQTVRSAWAKLTDDQVAGTVETHLYRVKLSGN